MKFTVLTLFPELVDAFFNHGMIQRGRNKKLIQTCSINIRDFSADRHKTVDDRPYGGGSGMVMKPEVLQDAIEHAKKSSPDARAILLSPQGSVFRQETARQMADGKTDLILVCGRYEGIDERIIKKQIDEEISIGDYVMTGGELAAMVIVDAVSRMIPGVLGSRESFETDSFYEDRIEYAQYTRPELYEDERVPEILLSGDHEKIRMWRKASALKRTFLKRPDLMKKTGPDTEEKKIIEQWIKDLKTLLSMSP